MNKKNTLGNEASMRDKQGAKGGLKYQLRIDGRLQELVCKFETAWNRMGVKINIRKSKTIIFY